MRAADKYIDSDSSEQILDLRTVATTGLDKGCE
jgi:hypothetical protein